MRVSLLLMLLAACGGIAYEDYDNEASNAYCDYLVRCHAVATVGDCRAYYDRLQVESPSLDAAIEAGSVRYDEDAAQACIDAFGSLSCDETRLSAGALGACDDVYEGAISDGGACGFDLECISGHCAKQPCSEACCPGTCRPAVSQPDIDEPCSVVCVDGAFCGADSICHAYLPAGGACDAVSPCDYGLYCAGRSMSGSGVCTALPRDGEACETGCAERGSICFAGTCSPVGLTGDACEVDNQCAQFYRCTSSGTCGRLPTLGMDCSATCAGEAYCEGGICVEQKPVGGSCNRPDMCASHNCGGDLICHGLTACI